MVHVDQHTLDPTNPDLQALILTIGITRQLTQTGATTAEWDALTRALEAEHTPAELAHMLTAAAALIARAPDSLQPAAAR